MKNRIGLWVTLAVALAYVLFLGSTWLSLPWGTQRTGRQRLAGLGR